MKGREPTDRTPTQQRLEVLIKALGEAVQYVRSRVQYDNLDENAMAEVMRFLGQNHSRRLRTTERVDVGFSYVPSIYSTKGTVVFYDIGYRLIKDQMIQESILEENEKPLLFDGVMGWFHYYPGKGHDAAMNQALKNYAAANGAEALSTNFSVMRRRFNEFRPIAEAADALLMEFPSSSDRAYQSMFAQFFVYPGGRSTMDLRQRQIEALVPGFRVI